MIMRNSSSHATDIAQNIHAIGETRYKCNMFFNSISKGEQYANTIYDRGLSHESSSSMNLRTNSLQEGVYDRGLSPIQYKGE